MSDHLGALYIKGIKVTVAHTLIVHWKVRIFVLMCTGKTYKFNIHKPNLSQISGVKCFFGGVYSNKKKFFFVKFWADWSSWRYHRGQCLGGNVVSWWRSLVINLRLTFPFLQVLREYVIIPASTSPEIHYIYYILYIYIYCTYILFIYTHYIYIFIYVLNLFV